MYSLPAGGVINALEFSPNRYWLVAATDVCIRIWDLEGKTVKADLNLDIKSGPKPRALSLAWNANGTVLYAGYTDAVIRVWEVK